MFKNIILACLVAESMAVQIKSDPICNSAGCTQYKHPEKETFKKNYFVPNFGRDHDINVNFDSLRIAEEQLGRKMKFPDGKYKKKDPVDYNFSPRLDGDVISTQKNLADTESVLGHKWKLTDMSDFK